MGNFKDILINEFVDKNFNVNKIVKINELVGEIISFKICDNREICISFEYNNEFRFYQKEFYYWYYDNTWEINAFKTKTTQSSHNLIHTILKILNESDK